MRPVDALLRVLREEGVTKVFGNPGTTELPFLDALAGAADIEYVLGVHEGSVVAMADGYARATGRPAFVSLHVAAGLANGLVGLLNASRSRTPLVVTAGQQDRRHLVQDPMLSGDLVGLARAAVKHTFDVQHAHDLPVLLRRAFQLAVRPPAGPVFLSVPMDLLAEDTDVTLPARSTLAPPGVAGGVAEAARLLAGARRPAIVAGDGVGRDGAVAELVAVAEALGAVVHHQPMHDGVDFPGTHPLHAGALPPLNAAIRETLAAHDVVFIVGCHAFMPHHYTPGPAVPDSVTVVQLDSDSAEPGRNFPVALGMTGGIRATLARLAEALAGRVPRARQRIAAAAASHAARRAAADAAALAAYGPAPFDPLAAVHAVVAGLPEDAVVVEEAITSGVRLRSVLRLDRPGSLVHTVGGGLGSGIGAAVGHAMGRPERPVVAVLGDGCSLFGLQGLWSAARYGARATFVVMNNGEYRTLKETLDAWRSRATATGHYPGLDLATTRLDFTKAAEFFGVPAVRAKGLDGLTETVAKSALPSGPLLVDVPVTSHSSHR
ncbi:thiamine pyrophosphate-binding protein [Streptomyces sp. UNOB3_S3]|uniref:thiamine pyrophosphate-binding protein n=1 Tax=Streptomyces sp. UNOB3_S3 TaxID=2871682 RepID=UPI001E4C2F70|nr:thiamine pyrophosphate-binding protein [Streptomyces sp. UNOB3_S3]MCC3775013.1 thiamine pyrophosphate-binding protein [Streptomyces sp. UNOB3_S3]